MPIEVLEPPISPKVTYPSMWNLRDILAGLEAGLGVGSGFQSPNLRFWPTVTDRNPKRKKEQPTTKSRPWPWHFRSRNAGGPVVALPPSPAFQKISINSGGLDQKLRPTGYPSRRKRRGCTCVRSC